MSGLLTPASQQSPAAELAGVRDHCHLAGHHHQAVELRLQDVRPGSAGLRAEAVPGQQQEIRNQIAQYLRSAEGPTHESAIGRKMPPSVITVKLGASTSSLAMFRAQLCPHSDRRLAKRPGRVLPITRTIRNPLFGRTITSSNQEGIENRRLIRLRITF